MNNQMDCKIFKGEKGKTYIVFPINRNKTKSDDKEYIDNANKHFKTNKSKLIIKNGFIMDEKDLYFEDMSIPLNLYRSQQFVKVVYKGGD